MNKTIILFFSSSTCGPCNLVKSQINDDIIKELNIKIINEKDWDSFVTHQVENVPTFIKINLSDSKELNRISGYKSIKELRSL